MASVEPGKQCGASSLDWALFFFSVLSTHVTWWLFPLPTLFRRGFKHYIHDVAWECLRLQVPSYTAFRACFGEDRSHWQNNYYSGVRRTSGVQDDVKASTKDSLIIVSTSLALAQLTTEHSENRDLSGLNSSLWNYPSLPVAIYGLSIFFFSKTSTIKLWQMTISTLVLICLVTAAVALVIAFTIGRGLWWPCTVLILFMAIPFWIIHPKLLFMTVILSALSRSGGQILGAVSTRAYFPFCAARGWAFAGPLLAFTIFSVLLAWYGATLRPRVEEPGEVEEMKEIP